MENNTSSPYIFEHLSYPLRGYKPLSILDSLRDDTIMVCIVVSIPSRFRVSDYLKLGRNILSRIPKSLRKKLRQRLHVCVIHGLYDKAEYEELVNNTAKALNFTWVAPEAVNRDNPSSVKYAHLLDNPLTVASHF